MRTILDIKSLAARAELPWSEHDIYKLIKRQDFPLPHKRLGKKYYFDLEAVYKWFDRLPGRNNI